jgi:hypothetical protein
LPASLARRATNVAAVPRGLAAYLSVFDVPRWWQRWRTSLSTTPNLGLLLRWRAALAEMYAFQSLGRQVQDERVRDLCRRMDAELRGRRCLEVVAAPVADRNGEGRSWDARQTIWSFVLKREQPTRAERVLNFDEAWQVYTWLNRDLSAMLPSQATANERNLAAIRCHIGQPVRIRWRNGDVAGALRMALSARSVSASSLDPGCVFDKIEVILRYWPQLTAQQAVA